MIPCPTPILPFSVNYKPLGEPTDIDQLLYQMPNKATSLVYADSSRPAIQQAMVAFEQVRERVASHRGIYSKTGELIKHGHYWLCLGFAAGDAVHRKDMPAKAVCVGFSYAQDENLIKVIDVRPDGMPRLVDVPPAIDLYSSGGVVFEAVPVCFFSYQ